MYPHVYTFKHVHAFIEMYLSKKKKKLLQKCKLVIVLLNYMLKQLLISKLLEAVSYTKWIEVLFL